MNVRGDSMAIPTIPGLIVPERFAMSSRCLHCRTAMKSMSSPLYEGDFCSEFCLSQYPGSVPRGRAPLWVKQVAADMMEVKRILERNHGILRAFRNRTSQGVLASDVPGLIWLEQQGFDFEHHTSLRTGNHGVTEVWCYDEGYRLDPWGGVTPL